MPLLEEAVVSVTDDDVLRHVQILNAMASNLYHSEPVREGELAREAVALAEQLGDPHARATAQLALHRWYTHLPAARAERLAIARYAGGCFDDATEPGELQLLLQRSQLGDLIESGQREEFDATLVAYERAAAEFGSPRDIYWASALRATQMIWHGDLIAGEQLARGAVLRGTELEQTSAGAFILQRFVVRYQQGRLAEELRVLREVRDGSSVFRGGRRAARGRARPTPDSRSAARSSLTMSSARVASCSRATCSGCRG